MKASLIMRVWFASMASILWAGIFITGVSVVNWLLFLPAAGLTIASLAGICPAHIVLLKLFGNKEQSTSSSK